MPKSLTQLTVFLSSPSNLAAERSLIEKVINDLSRTMEQDFGIVFRVLRWETDIIPGISVDPQTVINEQTSGHFDIYIGLLGMRFGTPTARAGSGTEEEFRLAYSQFKETLGRFGFCSISKRIPQMFLGRTLLNLAEFKNSGSSWGL